MYALMGLYIKMFIKFVLKDHMLVKSCLVEWMQDLELEWAKIHRLSRRCPRRLTAVPKTNGYASKY